MGQQSLPIFIFCMALSYICGMALDRSGRDAFSIAWVNVAGLALMLWVALGIAWLAHAMGAPELLGGFAAGLALSRRFFLPFGLALRHDPVFAGRIETQMQPIIHLFVPIFFVMVGLSLNLRAIDWTSPFIWSFSLSLFAVAVLGKLLGVLPVRGAWRERFAIGIAMVPRGEVGLIFAVLRAF
ncbi:MAG: sodium:proton antiporter [Proteobacteria bacterium]|nr:sodium:proton antiporter [Pseudomonadota bacterium]